MKALGNESNVGMLATITLLDLLHEGASLDMA